MSPFNWRKTQPQPSSFIAVSLFYRESSSFAHVKWVKTVCLTLALCVCSISAFGESTMVDTTQAKTYSFDIPILRADVALIEFAEQAGRTLLFSFDETKLKTGKGRASASDSAAISSAPIQRPATDLTSEYIYSKFPGVT